MELENNDGNKVAKPVFKLLSRDLNRVYCEVCLKSWDTKNKKRSKLGKVNKADFKEFARKWSEKEHEFNKVLIRTNWDNDVLYNCKPCRSSFWRLS